MSPASRSGSFSKAFILGAGAVGSYYGAALSRGVDVALIGRESHVDAIKEYGLTVSGKFEGVFRVGASTEIEEIPENALIILTTKAYDAEGAIKGVKALLKPDTTILVLQNGLGNEGIVRGVVGPEVRVIRGITSVGAEFLAPSRIDVKLIGETIMPDDEVGRDVKALFDACGVEVRLSGEMDYEIWRKLALNCVLNPLTTIFRVPNNEVAVDSLRGVRDAILDECVKVAERECVTFEPDLAQKITDVIGRYSNISSMCQDILKGKRTEIDFLNGMVCELGRRHGVPTPVNDTVVSLIKFMEGKSWS
ncbi:MAG TPA: ketopantoate reductase family protein [Patescibacteria group bacterium]|nr:ketopantoate reductase family protein [Patescibacteria group bacterium]